MSIILSILGLTLGSAILLVPAWWATGRLQNDRTSPFFRLLCAIGLALVGYIVVVNLIGKLTGNSFAAVLIHLLLNAAAGQERLGTGLYQRDSHFHQFRIDLLTQGVYA